MNSTFTFLIFQSIPHRGKVYFWPDGGSARHITDQASFLDVILDKTPLLLGEARKALNTYSFYLLSIPDKTLNHLPPQTTSTEYKDSVMVEIFKGISKHSKNNNSSSLAELLAKQGFSEPEEGLVNLKKIFDKKEK